MELCMHYPSTIKSCCRWRRLESILSIPISFSLQLGMLLLGRLLVLVATLAARMWYHHISFTPRSQHQQLKFTVIVHCSVAHQICQPSLAGAEYMGLQSEHFVWYHLFHQCHWHHTVHPPRFLYNHLHGHRCFHLHQLQSNAVLSTTSNSNVFVLVSAGKKVRIFE